MFKYTKILPLTLLLSIPLIAMDEPGATDIVPAPAAALVSTMLLSGNLSTTLEESTDLQSQIDALKKKQQENQSRMNEQAMLLEKKYTSKCAQICDLDAKKKLDEKNLKDAEQTKTLALETIDTQYAKARAAKTQDHDTTIAALTKTLTDRTDEIKKASDHRDNLHKQLEEARKLGPQEKPNTLLAFFGF